MLWMLSYDVLGSLSKSCSGITGHNRENLEHNRVYCGDMPKPSVLLAICSQSVVVRIDVVARVVPLLVLLTLLAIGVPRVVCHVASYNNSQSAVVCIDGVARVVPLLVLLAIIIVNRL